MSAVMQNARLRSAQKSYDNRSPAESEETPLIERFNDMHEDVQGEVFGLFLEAHRDVEIRFADWLDAHPDLVDDERSPTKRAWRLIRGVMPWITGASESVRTDLARAEKILRGGV